MNNAPKAGSSKAAPIVIAILALGCAGLAYFAAQQWRSLVNAETEVAQLRAKAVQVAPAEALQARNDALRARVAELEKQLSAVPPPAPAPAPAEPAKPSFGALAASMMNNPAMRDMMARSQKLALERKFADLMTQLGLSPEDRARFIGLLAEKQMNTTEIGLKMMSGNQTPEERAAVGQQIKDANAAVDARIRDFFSDPAAYATYQDYLVQQPLRAEVTALNTSLAASGQQMSPEQSSALATVITETRRDFAASSRDIVDPTNDPQAALNGPALDAFFQHQQQMQSQIADRAAAFLTPEQVAALRQSQASRMDQMKNTMNMARQMMGSGK